ncbi:MAG: ParB/RepB/Spo0J family partition protein, partial [Deltaproteobacteria bacterium]|nr:ParB/RepB/Spo0J family partition protein [Deltaproteobacteria bacterium]
AGLVSVPAVFIDSQNYAEISLVENLLRQDLTPVEEAEALERLRKDHTYQQDDIARILGKSKTIISETLSLNRLPQEVLNECRKDPSVPKRVLIEIARKKQERSMLTAYWQYKATLTPKKKTATGVKTTKAQSAFNAMDATEQKIKTLDVQTLSPEEKQNFIIAIGNMKRTLETVLTAVTQPPPEDGSGAQNGESGEPKTGKNLA